MKTKLVTLLFISAAALLPSATARVVGRLYVNGPATNATAKIEVAGGPVIYVDPAVLPATTPADADFILITHNHGDHQELNSINRIRKAGTVIYSSTPGVPALTNGLANTGVAINAVTPGQKLNLGGVEVETVPMYNIVKTGHLRVMNYVGYVLNVGGVRIYAAGDTERVPEMKTFTTDIALLPLGQTFTMVSVQDAADAALDVRARLAIPYHYARGEGTLADGNTFVSLLNGRIRTMLTTPTEGLALEVPDIAAHPASQTVAPGAAASFSVQATGSGTVSYQWQRNGTAIVGATNAALSIASTAAANAGDYTVTVSDANATLTSQMARLVVETPRSGQLVNLSVRAATRPGVPLIVGAATTGGSKSILVRGIGPTLAAFGVAGPLPDPRVDVHATVAGVDTIVTSNNDWATGGAAALRAAFTATGAFDLANTASLDAALLTTIDTSRTIHVADTAGRTGVALVEVYDTDPTTGGRLANLSARNFAGTGDAALIAGFVVSGNVPKRLLIRGIGPSLAAFGVTGALADPRVELFLSEGGKSTLFASNDSWAETGAASVRAAFSAVAAFNLPDAASKDAALVVTVPAGTYTAQVSGAGAATGEALVEIYELP
ncbi:MAG: MBL fold metallo-hydrolase [Verrucomicrobia bacterium]|nr:MBL fold metallo-hydrolase [Verrucomicrobiota bacterium]